VQETIAISREDVLIEDGSDEEIVAEVEVVTVVESVTQTVLVDAPEQAAEAKPAAKKAAKKAARPKGRRASVPSWDEILFGATRGDDA